MSTDDQAGAENQDGTQQDRTSSESNSGQQAPKTPNQAIRAARKRELNDGQV